MLFVVLLLLGLLCGFYFFYNYQYLIFLLFSRSISGSIKLTTFDAVKFLIAAGEKELQRIEETFKLQEPRSSDSTA